MMNMTKIWELSTSIFHVYLVVTTQKSTGTQYITLNPHTLIAIGQLSYRLYELTLPLEAQPGVRQLKSSSSTNLIWLLG
jgi:hypothetical protein